MGSASGSFASVYLMVPMMKVRICPRCNSPKIELDRRAWIQAAALKAYACRNCGFGGYLFPEIEVKNLNELKKLKIKKKSEFKKKNGKKFKK